ncbi:MAG: cation:dicarboxylase symporter family transporter [Bacillota bacterium]|nr:cation:dicarboxylase symporter family transporter [Bacillota bacterium]
MVRSFLTECKLPKRDVIRYAITIEEILLKTSDNIGAEIPVRLITGTRFFRPYVALELDGKSCNVYAEKESEQGVLGGGVLKNLGLSPEYAYTGETNKYFFRIRRKSLNPAVSLMTAVALALTIGSLGYLMASGTRTMLMENVINPLNDTFLDILGCIAGPMVFLAVAWGIYGIGDAATLKRIGQKLILSYIGTIFIAIIVIGMMCLPFFSLDLSGSSGGSGAVSAVVSMLPGVIPKDIFSPFTNGNTLQIIILAVAIGIAMLFFVEYYGMSVSAS